MTTTNTPAHERLSQAHMRPLAEFAQRLRDKAGVEFGIPPDYVPNFDPDNGGVLARALFLMEAPGPGAVKSRIVSPSNNDQTAKNLKRLFDNAGIAPGEIILWNIVPWYVGTGTKIRPVNSEDLRHARPYLLELLALLPELRVIVLLGNKAKRGWAEAGLNVSVVSTYHPSPLVFNTSPEREPKTQEAFNEAAALIRSNAEPCKPNIGGR